MSQNQPVAAIGSRARVLVLGSVVLVAVLAGAADRAVSGSGPIAIPHEPLIVAVQTVLWLVVAAAMVFVVLIVYAVATDRSPIVTEPVRRQSFLTYLMALVPTLFVAAVLYLRRPGAGNGLFGPFGFGAPPPGGAAGQANASQGPNTVWLSLLIASLLTAIFLTWLFWPARRQPRRRRSIVLERTGQPMVEAVEESMDVLRAIVEPRQAIIAAYSSMEASLTRAGVPRRVSDTPFEFLSRALAAVLGISSDANRLTYLFEFAKFSRHDVDESMRSDALDALQNIRMRITTTAA